MYITFFSSLNKLLSYRLIIKQTEKQYAYVRPRVMPIKLTHLQITLSLVLYAQHSVLHHF